VPKERVRVLISRRNHSRDLDECLSKLQLGFGEVDAIESGSALKFCRLAEGRGDIYPRFSPCCEWDTAAGQAVLEAAGGELLTVEYSRFLYNQKESLINPHFYAIGGRLSEWRSKLP
jgi:3'(2'), 5'-bisphosphate nucleotidase